MINLVVIAATLLAYGAPLTDPKFTWVISFFGLFYPLLLMANLLFIFFWAIKKPLYILPSLICILIGWTHVEGFIGFKKGNQSNSNADLKVMTCNISNASHGYHKDKQRRNEKKDVLINLLKNRDDIDVFCFQEVGEYALGILKTSYKNYKFHQTQKGAVILSRHPIIKKGQIDFGTITNSCLWADIKVGSDTVRFYSFHLQSNRITNDAEKIAEKMEFKEKQTWYDIKGILRKYRNNHIKRSKQAELIAKHAASSPYPVILAGDMNDPPLSYTYKVLSKNRTDSFKAKGSGLGTTYAGVIPFLRIDYVFADTELVVQECDVIKKDFSDHFPIVVSLNFIKS
ncbi:MAG: endonuclease/exonuclease/phosphatase family protein [Saprospiraceae bacterium]|nr:endonuclease/exonuclease/phosphatase family protein [Saprospiraceae bacterium]